MSVLGPCSTPPPLEPPGWRSAAACAGLPPKVVFSKKAKEAAPALRACAGCTVRRHCEAAVAPAESWFDGVCGGRLWRSGRPVPLPANLPPATPKHSAAPTRHAVPQPAGPRLRTAHDGGRLA
ncbi:WhiB family transcriptional regulator [Streptomyces bungoensis]|uniref:WhiB family transcriptional regulator n=1 Tax=Streptomyces bungoensis TaxID=285568 RepID=UPI00099EC3DA|nr:WhiB family transcriptional regulator [Streptomyces bungoensis]